MHEQEAKLKATQEKQYTAQTPAIGTLGGYALDEPARPPVRQRVEMAAHRANQSARQLEQLRELANLLDKNPDIGRILDLYELVRY